MTFSLAPSYETADGERLALESGAEFNLVLSEVNSEGMTIVSTLGLIAICDGNEGPR